MMHRGATFETLVRICVVLLGVVAVLGFLWFSQFFTGRDIVLRQESKVYDALSIAQESAQAWRSDARLAQVNSEGGVTDFGLSRTWRFIFVSESVSGTGYVVSVVDGSVHATELIPFSGSGASLVEHALSEEEIIERVRSIHGYEAAEVLGMELVYNDSDATWYWGVQTSRGVVSVKAER